MLSNLQWYNSFSSPSKQLFSTGLFLLLHMFKHGLDFEKLLASHWPHLPTWASFSSFSTVSTSSFSWTSHRASCSFRILNSDCSFSSGFYYSKHKKFLRFCCRFFIFRRFFSTFVWRPSFSCWTASLFLLTGSGLNPGVCATASSRFLVCSISFVLDWATKRCFFASSKDNFFSSDAVIFLFLWESVKSYSYFMIETTMRKHRSASENNRMNNFIQLDRTGSTEITVWNKEQSAKYFATPYTISPNELRGYKVIHGKVYFTSCTWLLCF